MDSAKEDILEVLKIENIDGICLSSILHYSVLKNADAYKINKKRIGNTQFLENQINFGSLRPYLFTI